MYIAVSMSVTYIQLIQQCTLAIWGGGVTLNFYPKMCRDTLDLGPKCSMLFQAVPNFVRHFRPQLCLKMDIFCIAM